MAKSIRYVRTEAQSRWRNLLLVSAGTPGDERDDDVSCYNVTQYPHPRVERTINTERERVDTAAFGREVHKEVPWRFTASARFVLIYRNTTITRYASS